METYLYIGGAGVLLGIGVAFLLGSDGAEKALLVALSLGAGFAIAKAV